jgi:hypothetical protein
MEKFLQRHKLLVLIQEIQNMHIFTENEEIQLVVKKTPHKENSREHMALWSILHFCRYFLTLDLHKFFPKMEENTLKLCP